MELVAEELVRWAFAGTHPVSFVETPLEATPSVAPGRINSWDKMRREGANPGPSFMQRDDAV
jgi:hypothetical protein